MARKKGFIPSSGPAYDAFFKNICQYVNAKCSPPDAPEWSHIPPAEQTALNDAYADWYAAYTPTLKPHTPAETAAKNRAYKSSRKVLSRFIQVWFRGFTDIVTEEDLKNMGIPPVDTVHTPIGRPATRPAFEIHVRDTRLLAVPFRDQGAASRAIPYGMNGAVVSFGIFDHPPAEPEELSRTELATRSPHLLHFTEEERGKTVYVALQWQNESGVRGDYTEMLSTIVP
jgi:hypothetical protein